MTLVIRHTATELTIETTRKAFRDSRASTETLTYMLDGSEATISSGSGAPVKTRVRWDGPKLVTEALRTVNGAPITVRHVLSVDESGKQLSVEKRLTVQHGYQSPSGNNTGTGTDIFVRASAPEQK
jgi:hypothetical protein